MSLSSISTQHLTFGSAAVAMAGYYFSIILRTTTKFLDSCVILNLHLLIRLHNSDTLYPLWGRGALQQLCATENTSVNGDNYLLFMFSIITPLPLVYPAELLRAALCKREVASIILSSISVWSPSNEPGSSCSHMLYWIIHVMGLMSPPLVILQVSLTRDGVMVWVGEGGAATRSHAQRRERKRHCCSPATLEWISRLRCWLRVPLRFLVHFSDFTRVELSSLCHRKCRLSTA